MSLRLLAIIASLLFAGAAVAQTDSVEITDCWARATPGKTETGGVYLTIVSPVADRVTAVSTPVAQKAGLHTMSMEGGVMRMRPLGGLDLAPGQKVMLKPGGTHIMLIGLVTPLEAGKSFPLTLSFEKAGSREVTVAVEKAGAMGPESQGSSNMPMGNMPMQH